jgi:hypothetical protein
VKVKPLAGVAVKVTAVPELKGALQVLPQFMPAGELVMLPLPGLVTLKRYGLWTKLAPTFLLEVIVSVQAPVPEQSPVQPVKV